MTKNLENKIRFLRERLEGSDDLGLLLMAQAAFSIFGRVADDLHTLPEDAQIEIVNSMDSTVQSILDAVQQ